MILGIKECVVTDAGYMSRTVTGKAAVKYSIGEWSHPQPELSELGFGLFYHPDIECIKRGPSLRLNELLLCEVAGPLPLPTKILVFPEDVYAQGPFTTLCDAEMKPEAGSAMACGLRPIAKVTHGSIVYKVVSANIRSACMRAAAGIQYGIGQVSVAPKHLASVGMYVTALPSLEDAMTFKNVHCDSSYRVFKAIGLEEQVVPTLTPSSFWAEYPDVEGESHRKHMRWFPNTRMYRSLILTEEVA